MQTATGRLSDMHDSLNTNCEVRPLLTFRWAARRTVRKRTGDARLRVDSGGRRRWSLLGMVCSLIIVTGGRVTAQGFNPAQAEARMTAADGLAVTLFASEPEVRQPILTKVDDRGRLWTIQYLQYPNPAGLQRIAVDRWSRTVYDRVPEPPPHGPRGADRITILTDSDGDGRADRFHDFVDGLNLATGLEFGHGGVYVLQAPYLLFYPDRDRDDAPDAEPDVLLTGFGMEDAQSLANHLTWGPDGWLYGVNGSTTTCHIRGVEFQQGVWRYHPLDDRFELYCEGGGNTFGLTFDERGNLFYSTNGGPFIHALQGAYYRKSFGKHGPLHNLHAYGFFEIVERDQMPLGPPTGGTIYLGDAFPERFRGAFIAGNFLGHAASWWTVRPAGSTFTAQYGGELLEAHDTWFGATDMCTGPDGAMYISDFYDQRTAHPDPDADWDTSNGRIYRIAPPETPTAGQIDIAAMESAQLVELLRHPNRWFADRARVELAARRDPEMVPVLRAAVLQAPDEPQALQALWALHVSGGFDEATARALLAHDSDYVRMWTVRLLGDDGEVSAPMHEELVRLAATESSPVVRCQLAATARRLESHSAIPLLDALVTAVPDDADPRTPWMIWWGMETHALSGRDDLLARFAGADAWSISSRRTQGRHLIRRWSAAGTAEGYAAALRMLQSAPADRSAETYAALALGLAERSAQLPEIEQGGLFEQFATAAAERPGRVTPAEPVPDELQRSVEQYWRAEPDDVARLRLALLCGVEAGSAALLQSVESGCRSGDVSVDRLNLLGEFGREDSVPLLLSCLQQARDDRVANAIVRVLGRFGGDAVTEALLSAYPLLSPASRATVIDVLLARPESAALLLEQVRSGSIDPADVSLAQVRIVALHESDELNGTVQELWGNVSAGTPEEKLAVMRRFNNDLNAGSGDAAAGQQLFVKHCGTCHVLFGEGNRIGPELTTANRKDRDALLANIVDPSAVVRREYINFTLLTIDGRVLTGLLAEQDAASVTVLDAKNERTRIPREEIDELRESTISLMPDDILQKLTPQERRNLFAYLMQ